MEAVRLALTDPNISEDAANRGFLRQYAKLAVIMAGDEDDQSPGTVGYYADFLRSLKGARNAEMLSVSVLGAVDATVNPPVSRYCRDKTQEGADRFLELVATIGNGRAFRICAGDPGAAMRMLGLDAFSAITEYYLSRPADPATLSVWVRPEEAQDFAEVAADPYVGYTYDPQDNAVIFAPAAVPGKGAAIEVRYTARCD